MVFTSFNFLLAFPLFVACFYFTPAKYRWLTLLVASFLFYINIKPVYALLTAGITASTYLLTIWMSKTKTDERKRVLMFVNIVLVLLPLFFFKYFGAVNQAVFVVLEKFNVRWPLPEIRFLLPIGISYYTFMAIGYTIDVYNEEVETEKNIGYLALFISFFPLVLSGPIERAKNMLPQFHAQKKINYQDLSAGMKMMLWGYFLKLVVADRTGMYVDAVLNNIPQHNGTSMLFASILYPFQVYADLGGYSLLAIGTAKMLGLNVIPNFNRPFFATSMADFWRRWHISLISWLTDYIYTPLSFSFRKKGVWGIVIALMITFFISGIWHGASLTFIVWGLMQGVFLSIEALTNNQKKDLEKKYNLKHKTWYTITSIVFTFFLFAGSEVIDRAATVSDAFAIYKKIIFDSGSLFIDKTTLAYSFIGLLMLFFSEFRDEYFPEKYLCFNNKNIAIRYASYLCVTFLIILIGVLNGGQFIYFQF